MRTKYHRNGDVTYWDVYAQAWRRTAPEHISDETLATLPEHDRARIRARIVSDAIPLCADCLLLGHAGGEPDFPHYRVSDKTECRGAEHDA